MGRRFDCRRFFRYFQLLVLAGEVLVQLAPFAGFQPFAAAAVQHHHQIGQLDSNVDAQPNKTLPFKRQPVRQRAQARIDAGVDADAAGVAAFEQARGVA